MTYNSTTENVFINECGFVFAYVMLWVSNKDKLDTHCSTIMPISSIVLQEMGQKIVSQ